MRKLLSTRTKFLSVLTMIMASPVLSQPVAAPTLVALSGLESGQWQLRAAEASETRSICVADPSVMLQPRHSGSSCSKTVITNDAKLTTVHYSCPGAGYGRTTLRVETSRLVQIDSQGIADNAPFLIHYEARRTGSCNTNSAQSRVLTPRLPFPANQKAVLSFK
jgi:hypothetical protein